MVKEAMSRYFDRLLARWQALGSLPQSPVQDCVDTSFYVGRVDGTDDLMLWRSLEKLQNYPFEQIESGTAQPFHLTIKAYFNSYWFCSLGGRCHGYGLDLEPVLPGEKMRRFLGMLLGYRDSHSGRLDHIPIGIEQNGLIVVVSNTDGQVWLEDYERGTLSPLAPSLPDLIDCLQV